LTEKRRRRSLGGSRKSSRGAAHRFPFDNPRLGDTAADVKARFKLSLADAFAAALAKEKKAELVTGDPEFPPLHQEIKIHWLK
jgi:predicted nucleic acid-binding protein